MGPPIDSNEKGCEKIHCRYSEPVAASLVKRLLQFQYESMLLKKPGFSLLSISTESSHSACVFKCCCGCWRGDQRTTFTTRFGDLRFRLAE